MNIGKIAWLIVSAAVAVAAAAVQAADLPPAAGEPMPSIILETPDDPAARKYLGVTDTGSFDLTRIPAEVLILQVFSMYCPHCQREAPVVNRVFEIIQQDPRLKKRIRLVGIGAGNSAYEVGIFKEKYSIPFPLFEDADFVFHELLGEVPNALFFRCQGPAGRFPRSGLFAVGRSRRPATVCGTHRRGVGPEIAAWKRRPCAVFIPV